MNASDTFFNPYTRRQGSTECVNGWRGLTPLAMNPLFGAIFPSGVCDYTQPDQGRPAG